MKRLFIANRGEIAVRIARTAADMGLTTIGIYAKDDAASPHLRAMDETVGLPGSGARAYLDIDAVVSAAKGSGADAIHPGYGFLSERADFAEAVESADIVFVGPAPETLSLFGDKIEAVALAEELDVPTLSLAKGVLDTERAHRALADLPEGEAMVLKAVTGGGGRGVRIVRSAETLNDDFARASSEARAAFGNGELYAELYLDAARHIEVQILGDGQGSVAHLWDRDCTLQRRHQKLIEIAPSPFLTNARRAQITKAAVKLARETRFRGAGTFEFLVTENGKTAYFIEANARLQVEHTVTEQVLGVDLVAAQLAIAGGSTLNDLGLDQGNLPSPDGTAIQARINLESLQKDGTVRPSGGTLDVFSPPAGPGIRVDTYGRAGYKPSPAYDSLIAKVIASVPGGTYRDALRRLRRALSEFELEGPKSTLGILGKILADPRVEAGEVHTRFIDENAADFVAAAEADERQTADAAIGAAAPDSTETDHGDEEDSAGAGEDRALKNLTPITSPMTGIVVTLTVAPGNSVWEGRVIAVLESMKMEHEVVATASGIVRTLPLSEGDAATEGDTLLYLEPEDVTPPEEGPDTELDLDHIRPDLQEVLDRIGAGHDENRPEAVKKRKARGHRTARENIADLCDEGSFVEYGSVVLAAQRRRREMEDLISNTTGDGMVCGLGHVNGDQFPEHRSGIMAMSYDYMVLAGTQGALNHYKKDRMFEIAEHQRLPVVLYAEGGGGRPGDTDTMGVAGLDCLAFNYFAKLSGLVPTIGIVNGRCFAGNAVLLGCCDVIIATKNANIGIGGPAMIEGGGLGVFAPEEVGPSDVQVANGVIDILVEDEAEATQVARQYLSYFQGTIEDWLAPDARELRFAVPENRLRVYDMRKVIEGVADIGSVLELRPTWGVGIITCFARIEGRPVGIVANDPRHLSGAIDSPGADKGARFLQLCDAFDIPVVSLVDCPGIMVGPEIEKTALVRHASRMMVVGANVDIPIMGIVIRKGYGLGAQAMVGGSFKAPLFMVTWPTGEFGGMGLEGAVKLGYRKELEAIADPEERETEYQRRVAQMYERGKAVNMASHFEVDDVIDPADTRNWIMAGLKSLPPRPIRTGKKRPNVDAW
ncbi:MAG: carboxyl transferase domain-containing protein [Pseudomonadota bacterium]